MTYQCGRSPAGEASSTQYVHCSRDQYKVNKLANNNIKAYIINKQNLDLQSIMNITETIEVIHSCHQISPNPINTFKINLYQATKRFRIQTLQYVHIYMYMCAHVKPAVCTCKACNITYVCGRSCFTTLNIQGYM